MSRSDHFRFIAPSSATDQDLDALLRRGAMPTFPAFQISRSDSFPSKDPSAKPTTSEGGLIKRASRSRHVVNAWFIGDSKSEGMASGPKQICCVDGTRYQSEISFALPADCTRSLVVKSG